MLVAREVLVDRIDWPHKYVTRLLGAKRKRVQYSNLYIEEFVFGFISMIISPFCKCDYHTMDRILRMLIRETIDFSWGNALALYELIGLDV